MSTESAEISAACAGRGLARPWIRLEENRRSGSEQEEAATSPSLRP